MLHARGEELLAQLWNGLSAIDGVTLYGPPPGNATNPDGRLHDARDVHQ